MERQNQSSKKPREIQELQIGGTFDNSGFYNMPDGSFYDPDGYFFDTSGKDEFGGYYDKQACYHPGEKNKHEFEDQFDDDYDDELIRQYERGHADDYDDVDPELEQKYVEYAKQGALIEDPHEEEEVVDTHTPDVKIQPKSQVYPKQEVKAETRNYPQVTKGNLTTKQNENTNQKDSKSQVKPNLQKEEQKSIQGAKKVEDKGKQAVIQASKAQGKPSAGVKIDPKQTQQKGEQKAFSGWGDLTF